MHLYQRIQFWALTFVALFVTVGANAAAAVGNPRPFVVPELTSWQGASGDFHPTGRIVVTDRAFLPVAERFAADYAELFSRRLTVVQGKGRTGDLVLSRADRRDTLGAEGYRLTVGETATITATTPQGAFWGTRTACPALWCCHRPPRLSRARFHDRCRSQIHPHGLFAPTRQGDGLL